MCFASAYTNFMRSINPNNNRINRAKIIFSGPNFDFELFCFALNLQAMWNVKDCYQKAFNAGLASTIFRSRIICV